MTRLTARSSTIFIATAGTTRVYRSIDEIPPRLREKLVASTRGINSATILIADKRGREELVRALQGRSSVVRCRLVENIKSREPAQRPQAEKRSFFRSLRIWLELFLPVAVGASLWFLIESRL